MNVRKGPAGRLNLAQAATLQGPSPDAMIRCSLSAYSFDVLKSEPASPEKGMSWLHNFRTAHLRGSEPIHLDKHGVRACLPESYTLQSVQPTCPMTELQSFATGLKSTHSTKLQAKPQTLKANRLPLASRDSCEFWSNSKQILSLRTPKTEPTWKKSYSSPTPRTPKTPKQRP